MKKPNILFEKSKEADMLGAKFDEDKPPVWRGLLAFFPNACLAVAALSKRGSEKYDWHNWKIVPDGVNRYTDALLRHLLAEANGEELDNESEFHHAVHVAWNALARLELLIRNRMPV